MSALVLVLLVWGALVTLVMALLVTAKDGDRAIERAAADELRVYPGPARSARGRAVHWVAPVEMLPDYEELGQVAAHIRHVLAVERVSVIVAEGDGNGFVAACVNAPGLIGERVPVEAKRVTGLLSCDEAAAMGLIGETPGGASWSYANVPLHGPNGVTGTVTVAARRVLAFTSGELRLIERLARRGAPRFERRSTMRTAA